MATTEFGKHSTGGYKEVSPGIRQKTLVYGARTLMTEFLLAKTSILPEHSHPYEQTGYLAKGHILLKIGDTHHDVNPGWRCSRSTYPRRLGRSRGVFTGQGRLHSQREMKVSVH